MCSAVLLHLPKLCHMSGMTKPTQTGFSLRRWAPWCSLAAFFAAATLACVPRDDTGETPSSSTPGPICPSCETAGGESSDFSGGRDAYCWDMELRIPIDGTSDENVRLKVEAQRALLEGEFTSPFRWFPSQDPQDGQPAQGYSDEDILVQGSIATGSAFEIVANPEYCSGEICQIGQSEPLVCPYLLEREVELEVSVGLTTSDGAFTATLSGRARDTRIVASESAQEVKGTLELKPELPMVVRLELRGVFGSDGLDGYVLLGGRAFDRGDPVGSYKPLAGCFPTQNDACNVPVFAVDDLVRDEDFWGPILPTTAR